MSASSCSSRHNQRTCVWMFGQTEECTKSAPESANTRNPGGPQPVRTPVVGLAESTCSNSKFADNLGTVAQRSRAAASRHHWKRVTSESSGSPGPTVTRTCAAVPQHCGTAKVRVRRGRDRRPASLSPSYLRDCVSAGGRRPRAPAETRPPHVPPAA